MLGRKVADETLSTELFFSFGENKPTPGWQRQSGSAIAGAESLGSLFQAALIYGPSAGNTDDQKRLLLSWKSH